MGAVLTRGDIPSWNWVTPEKEHGTSDLGKNPGLGIPWKGPGTIHWGTPGKDMDQQLEVLWDGDRVPPPPPGVNRQTPLKTVPSRPTTYTDVKDSVAVDQFPAFFK